MLWLHVLSFLAAVQATAAGVGGAGGALHKEKASLQKLQRLVRQAHTLNGNTESNVTSSMVQAAREVVKGLVERVQKEQPTPGQGNSILDSLKAAAAAAAPVRVHRGQLLVERSKALNAMGRTDEALAGSEEAMQLLQAELDDWVAGPEAGTPVNGTGSEARRNAAAALGSVLDMAAVWRQLGMEERANGVLAEALRVAPLVPSTPNYLRALAQRSQFTDEQLRGALDCMAHVERQTGAPAGSEEGGVGCSWMKLKKSNGTLALNETVADVHRLFYAVHRGLHSRKRYAEAWQALAQAKAMHYSKHTYAHRDFEQMVDDTVELFPSPDKFVDAVAEGDEKEPPSPSLALLGVAYMRSLMASTLQWRPWRGASAPSSGQTGELEAPAEEGESSISNAATGSSGSTIDPATGLPETIPIFVMGMPRSGSTLAEQILASHPDVYGAGEHTSLRTVTNRLKPLISGNRTVTPTVLTQLRRRYLASMRSKIPVEHRGAKWFVDKALSNAWLVGHIALMMPQACLVHAVRHPADASLSSFQQSFFPDKVPWSFNLTNIAAHMKAHHRLMEHWDSVLPGRVLHLHYDHMVRDQEGTTRRLVEHCGLPWDPSFLRFYETERSVLTASQLQVRKPIYSSSLNKWPVYKEGLAPLLVELRDTILDYEAKVGLTSSRDMLDEVEEQLIMQQEEQRLEMEEMEDEWLDEEEGWDDEWEEEDQTWEEDDEWEGEDEEWEEEEAWEEQAEEQQQLEAGDVGGEPSLVQQPSHEDL